MNKLLVYSGKRNKIHLETCIHLSYLNYETPVFNTWDEVLKKYPNSKPCKICRPDIEGRYTGIE